MTDNVTLTGATGVYDTATDEIDGKHYQRIKVTFGVNNVADDVSAANPLPVAIQGALGSVSVSNFPATQPISGAVSVSNFPATQPVTGTFWQATQPVSIAATVNVAGPLTDAQLRATPVVISPDATVEVAITGGVEALATETTLGTIASAIRAEDTAHTTGDTGIPMLGIRAASDTPTTSNDGDYTNLKVDEEGRLKVASKPASYSDITGDITAVQATIGTPVAGGTVSGDVSRASNVMMFCTGTFAGINVSFEGSLEATGDTNWFSVQAVRSNANTIETATGVLAAQPLYAWELSINALARVRVRCTARTSGTQSWRFKLGTYATEPIPAAQATATQPVSGTVTATVSAATLAIPAIIADVASAALTTTTTTAAIVPTHGPSYQVMIPVTVATGTNPTLDVSIEESLDSGTTWFKVYDFPRITTTGAYYSPVIPLTGSRVRYVQTVGGTTPSFTRAINRMQVQRDAAPIRQLIDRTINPNTLNSVTPSLDARDTGNRVQLVINVGVITTTAPALQLEGSDDNGATWYSIGSPLTAVASSTVQLTVVDIHASIVRARVSTAGVGVTAGYVMIKAHD